MNKSKNLDMINYWEFQPTADLMLVEVIPNESEKKTESGIVLSTQDSVVMDRPLQGVIKAVGPDSLFEVGQWLFWTKNAGYDLEIVRPDKNDNKYMVVNPESILGYKVKDNGNKHKG